MARKEDIALAKRQLDKYVTNRVKGQELANTNKDAYQKGLAASSHEAMQNGILKRTTKDVAYWVFKGNNQRKQATGSGLWCDGSAAIIMSELTNQPDFGGTLTVVSQGDPKLHGHWFVIADWDGTPLAYNKYFNTASYTLDIWGAIRGDYKSAVFDPGQCVYNCGDDNSLVVHCTAKPPYENDGAVTGSEEDTGLHAGRKKKCLIATTAFEVLGLPTDAPELERLRWFRDEILASQQNGIDRIAEYYRLAPALVEAIDRHATYTVYESMHRDYIIPALSSIDRGDFVTTFSIFDDLLCRMRNLLDTLNRPTLNRPVI